MKPIDYRNSTFSGIVQELHGRLQSVYSAWIKHGPGTTRQIAERSGIDLLNVRPRTTDLVHIGLVKITGGADGQGIYEARSQSEWESWMIEQRGAIKEGQLSLI